MRSLSTSSSYMVILLQATMWNRLASAEPWCLLNAEHLLNLLNSSNSAQIPCRCSHAVAEPPQLELRRREEVNVYVVDVSFVPFVRVSIDVPGQVVFEVLVQPSRHAPVAVVECVERVVLKPELLRQLVPAEALLQREDNASFSRCSRSVSCWEKICSACLHVRPSCAMESESEEE